MPIQSYLMMYFAGSAWQFGKRKISAKSNEEFNKLTMKTLLEEHTMELKSVIPTLEKSLNDVTPLVGVLIEQYGDFIKEALRAVPQALQNAIGGGGEFANIPTTSGTGQGPAYTASFLHYFKSLSDATKINIPAKTGLAEFENTEAKRRALQEKFNLQFQREKALLDVQRKAEERKRIRTIIPQLSIIEQARQRKRKAGQSQKMERKKLIIEIKQMKVNIAVPIRGRSSSLLRQAKARRALYIRLLKQHSQSLANLQGRYQF